jgi:predicted metalloprotease
MDWQKARRSDNVVKDDGRGGGGFGGGGGGGLNFGGFHIGIGGIILIVVVSLLFGKNPLDILALLGGDGSMSDTSGQQATPQQRSSVTNSNDPQEAFVQHVLGSTEDVWGPYFQAAGRRYVQPKLVLYHGRTPTACGLGRDAMGPFYCPGDQQVYLDLSFFQEMDTRLRARGDFARAYVIAHEIGHHVQNLLGVIGKVDQARRQGASLEGATGLSVRQELQADCFAGVWANRSQAQLDWLHAGDIEAGLNAASAVGDDALQKQSRGYAVPDSFTHGTSAQRQRWFKAGFASGDINSCDTFNAPSL